jgi:hypothetical protein
VSPTGRRPAVLLITAGVALGTVAGPIVALPAAVLAPERRAVGMGLFWLAFFAPMTPCCTDRLVGAEGRAK